MKPARTHIMLAGIFSLAASSAMADDLEGRIESINQQNQTFVVQGVVFYATPSTDYDDGLRRFADLTVGQKVEVDFEYRNGKHYATEIELED